jgi:hypothetical protein
MHHIRIAAAEEQPEGKFLQRTKLYLYWSCLEPWFCLDHAEGAFSKQI